MKEFLTIPALDGYPLKLCTFFPRREVKGAILLCPGLGIPKEYYNDYCSFLAEERYAVVVFDYRGIGKEEEQSEYEINLRNWAILDIPGVLNWVDGQFPDKKIYLFGHSIAGQMAGLIPNHKLVERFVFISSTGGYWTQFDFPLNLLTLFMFWFHVPLTARLFGYMPPSLTYRGVGIAKGVALEWAAISRKKDYLSAFFGKTINEEFYKNIGQKIDWISFEDDAIATARAIQSMMDYYPNAKITHHRIDPMKLNIGRVGHAGFFRRKARELWGMPLDLIETVD